MSNETIVGVIIVSYCSSDVILHCLESVLASEDAIVKIVVCDNASPDDTPSKIREWATGRITYTSPESAPTGPRVPAKKPLWFREYSAAELATSTLHEIPDVTLVRSYQNRGFAGGVNIGLNVLKRHPEIEMFWVLNPDTVADAQAASAYVRTARAVGQFGLMGGRTIYYEHPQEIQCDGGRVNTWTGVCSSVNLGCCSRSTEPPDPSSLDFIVGANLVASRAFVEQVGSMAEDYFLYYEEVDWAQRRGDLPLTYAQGAVVYHHGGISIGSPTLHRSASPFATYFNYRNRMRFMRRFYAARLPFTYAYSLLKILRLMSAGAWKQAAAAARGLHSLPPPSRVRSRLTSEAAARAFGKA